MALLSRYVSRSLQWTRRGKFSLMGLNVCIWVYLFNPNTWPMTSPKCKLRNYRLFREFLLSWSITALKNLYLHIFSVRKSSSFSFYDRRRMNFRAFASRGIRWLLGGLKLCPSKRHQHGVFIQSPINLDKTLFRISRIWNIAQTWFLARLFEGLKVKIEKMTKCRSWRIVPC